MQTKDPTQKSRGKSKQGFREAPRLVDFDKTPEFNYHDIQSAIAYVLRCKQYLTEDDFSMIRDMLPRDDYENQDMDQTIEAMMKNQLLSADSLKSVYFLPNGRIRVGVDAKEAHQALRASQQIIDTVFKKQGQIDQQAKLLTMERAILDVVGQMPEADQRKFTEYLEKNLTS